MPRKPRTSFLEDAITVASKLPWWSCLLLAAISFALFHMLAGMKAAASTPPEAISKALWIGVVIAGQWIAPLVFLIAAAVSGFRRMPRERVPDSSPSAPPTESGTWTGHVPEIPDHDLYDTWKEVTKTQAIRPSVDTSRWSKELLHALEWKRFEHLCARYFETLGFKSKVAREGADGGIDIHLYAEGSIAPAIAVQCKAWRTYKVGVKEIRELLGVMTDARVSEGVFITTGGYTAEARRFAAGNNIHLIDGEDLLKKIGAAAPEDERALLQLATAGDFTIPTCPSCGIKMVERVAQKTGERFWGCTSFPSCRRTFRWASS